MTTPRKLLSACIVLLAAATHLAHAGVDARMLRYPDVSATQIAFVYAGDIWLVPKEGGLAQRLSTPAGEESFPRFSPDGRELAFSANYDGNLDLYAVPVEGGLPRRLTHHPGPDRMIDWYPDGSAILFATPMTSGKDRFNRLYRTTPQGGLPEPLPLAYGELGAISPDGRTLAYMPAWRDFRTWKRYRGGWAPDIWLVDLTDLASRNITASDANDTQPMWHGSTLYFVSDRDANRRANLWAYDLPTGALRQVTFFEEFDVRFPAIGPSDIVFEVAGQLYLLDLASGKTRQVEVEVLTDEATLKPRVENVAKLIHSYGVSPSGKRAVFEARGEVFTVPAEHGPLRDLTRSPGTAERYPSWSPDGRTVAYFSDASGEYELTVRPADGSGAERRLTTLGPGFRYRIFWSPDSRKLAWSDQAMRIQVYDLDREAVVEAGRGLYLYEGDLESLRLSWSPDSRWLAWGTATANLTSAVFLFDSRSGERHQVTSGVYNASNPSFDPDGKYLYLLWGREFSPVYADFDNSWVYVNSTQVAAVPLRKDVASPLAARSDEEEGKAAEEAKGKDEDKGKKEGEGDAKKKAAGKKAAGDDAEEGEAEAKKPEPVEIDLDGFESRLVVLPIPAGNYRQLTGASGKVLYLRLPRTGAQPIDPDAEGPLAGAVAYYDLEEREEKTVLAEATDFVLAAGGEKLLVHSGDDFAIVDVAADQKLDKKLRTGELEATVDPPAEWRQIFRDAWRMERDFFYDPNMHGVDWPAMGQRYGALLDWAVTRWDVNFLIGELIGELSSSHTYRGGGDQQQAAKRGVGMLGVDFALDGGAYRIAHIVDVPAWETEVRSPLREPGVGVKEGDYLLAVNGVPLDPAVDPWAAFDGLAGQTVSLTVNSRPTLDGSRRVLVETLADEDRLRNLDWIEQHRRRVEEASGGRIGYIYVPSTGVDGQTELVRQFLWQISKEGLIVDERFNNGGQIPDRFIELLNRPLLNHWAVRDGPDWAWPPVGNSGPKAMLINGWSGSGGDLFPLYFRQAGLGPLIGTRTWGGLIGISGAPALIDGGVVTVPSFAIYSEQGEWIVEGHGVDPDIAVPEDPTGLAKGVDGQLERAIAEVLRQLEENPPRPPARPAYPDRSGR